MNITTVDNVLLTHQKVPIITIATNNGMRISC